METSNGGRFKVENWRLSLKLTSIKTWDLRLPQSIYIARQTSPSKDYTVNSVLLYCDEIKRTRIRDLFNRWKIKASLFYSSLFYLSPGLSIDQSEPYLPSQHLISGIHSPRKRQYILRLVLIDSMSASKGLFLMYFAKFGDWSNDTWVEVTCRTSNRVMPEILSNYLYHW